MSRELVLTNAELVLPDAVRTGTILVRDGLIAAIDAPGAAGLDLDGDLLVPGIVDLHTDNLERQVQPRSNARWPSRAAFLAHDSQCVAAGITTVLDALCVGDLGYEAGRVQTLRDALADRPALAGLLKAEHLLHLRCELPAADMGALLALAGEAPGVRMLSLMDHTPGFGQYGSVAAFRALRLSEGMAPSAADELVERLHSQRLTHRARNRASALALAAARGLPVAGHDDRTEAEVEANHADGIAISEFPVTLQAAARARGLGMAVIAGAPNLVRGGSHSGNVAVRQLLAEGLVDALASDYVPSSLVETLASCDRADLPAAVARICSVPARMAGLADRGALVAGLRGDLVQLHRGAAGIVVRRVWRGGVRVA